MPFWNSFAKEKLEADNLFLFNPLTGNLQTDTFGKYLKDEQEYNLQKQIYCEYGAERTMKFYFEKKGFEVFDTSFTHEIPISKHNPLVAWIPPSREVIAFLEKKFVKLSSFETWKEILMKAGSPDLTVIKREKEEIVDAFFVECKSPGDAVRFNQLMWMFNYRVPCQIAFCDLNNFFVISSPRTSNVKERDFFEK